MIPRYACHKLFKIQHQDKREWQNRCSPEKKGGPVWYVDSSKVNEGTLAGVYRWGLKRGHSFTLELHTMVSQGKIYAIKARLMEHIEK